MLRRGHLSPYRPHRGRKMWTPAGRTLAPDSDHIVAFDLSSTTSRAADSFLKRRVCVAGSGGKYHPAGGWIPAKAEARPFQEAEHVVDRRTGRTLEKAVVRRPFGQSDR